MTDACAFWGKGQVGGRQPKRTAILAIAGLSLLAWLPVAIPLVLLLRQ